MRLYKSDQPPAVRARQAGPPTSVAQYAFAIGDNATLTPRIDYGYVSSEWATLFENASQNDLLGARTNVNAQLYTYAEGTWKLVAYSTNLNDLHYVSQTQLWPTGFPGAPRQFGVRAETTF